MRIATVLFFLLVPLSLGNAEQITSTTSVTTDDFFVDVIGANSISFEGANQFDFSGDGIVDQQLDFLLVVETADSAPLTPIYDNGVQTGDLDLDSNLSSLLITYTIKGMTELPGSDPAFNYAFVSADFLGIEVTVDPKSSIVFADASASTNYGRPSTSWFGMERYGHWAASDVVMDTEYVFKASPEVGTQVLNSLTHSQFTVDVTAVPEPGVAGVFFALAMVLMKRRRV